MAVRKFQHPEYQTDKLFPAKRVILFMAGGIVMVLFIVMLPFLILIGFLYLLSALV